MGTTLTGTTPATTYDSLIKVTDNGPLSATAKYLSDGLGNDSALALSTGNIGVGYTSPTQKLSVAGNIKIAGAQAGNIAKLNLTRSDFSWSINNETDLRFYSATNDTDSPSDLRVAFTSAGNVGIGTTSPVTKLSVSDGTNCLHVGYDASGPYISGANNAFTVYKRLSYDATDHVFYSSSSESMRITSTGLVGIGTSSPAYPLDVVGAAQLSGELYMNNNQFLRFVRDSGSTSIQTLGIPSGTDDVRLLTTGDFNVVTGGLSTLMTVKSSGNVGIGTSSPSVKTEISGSASGDFAALALTNTNQAGTADAATLNFKLGRSVDSFLFTVPAIKFVKEQQWTSTGSTVDGALAFSTISNEATTEQARITSGGVLQLTQGQIKFPATQVASADPNTLDDYEEGTWTMGISFGGASVGVTYTSNTGSYTKIGRQVTVNGYLLLSNKGSSTGSARITGLPFTIANGNEFQSVGSMRTENITFADVIQCNAVTNATTLDLTETTNAGVISGITDADFANNSTIFLAFTYFV